MINIVQVYPYRTNNGYSVRIGKEYDINEPLEPSLCRKWKKNRLYVFVETKEEVKEMINLIKKLPGIYRGKMDSIDKLKTYMKSIHH